MKKPCDVDCVVSDWEPWSKVSWFNFEFGFLVPNIELNFCVGQCSGGKYDGKCGYGTETRTRYIKKHAKNGGKECPKELKESRQCLIKPCVDCKLGSWRCDKCNYAGIKKCYRDIIQKPYVSSFVVFVVLLEKHLFFLLILTYLLT